MVRIPDTWSDRIPKNISPKRQVECFRKAFHQGLTEHGFYCVGSELPEEKKPRAQTLLNLCRYYRPVNRDLLQIVDCTLRQIDDAMHNNGVFSRYAGIGGHIGINVLSLYDRFVTNFPPFAYGDGLFQQRVVHFQFPGMEKSFCNSFLNLFRDDFSYAMELEKQLFFEETLPWLDQMTTVEKYAQWRMETFATYYRRDIGASAALWPQLKLKRWDEAATCVHTFTDYIRKVCIKPEFMSAAIKEEVAFMEGILQAIARHDTQWIDSVLEDNKNRNLKILTCVSEGIEWEKAIQI